MLTIFVVEMMCYLLNIASQLCIQWRHAGCMKLAMMGVYILWKVANTTKWSCVFCFVNFLGLKNWWEEKQIRQNKLKSVFDFSLLWK